MITKMQSRSLAFAAAIFAAGKIEIITQNAEETALGIGVDRSHLRSEP